MDWAVNNSQSSLRPTSWAMQRLGYRSRGSFYSLVQSAGVPHVRLNSRTIRFDENSLESWIARRSVGKAAK